MSRLGKKPVDLPAGVEIKIETGSVTVKGKLGELTQEISPEIKVEVSEDGKLIQISREGEERAVKAKHGLYRSLIANMVEGVSKGFVKELHLEGVGYRVAEQGKKLVLSFACYEFSIACNNPIRCNLPTTCQKSLLGGRQENISL